jgi:hypothetical protein
MDQLPSLVLTCLGRAQEKLLHPGKATLAEGQEARGGHKGPELGAGNQGSQ